LSFRSCRPSCFKMSRACKTLCSKLLIRDSRVQYVPPPWLRLLPSWIFFYLHWHSCGLVVQGDLSDEASLIVCLRRKSFWPVFRPSRHDLPLNAPCVLSSLIFAHKKRDRCVHREPPALQLRAVFFPPSCGLSTFLPSHAAPVFLHDTVSFPRKNTRISSKSSASPPPSSSWSKLLFFPPREVSVGTP